MGGKRASSRKYIYVCAALLTCLTLCSCSVFQKLGAQDESRQYLDRGQKFFAQSDFDASLQENRKVLSLSADRPPSDEALFNIGLIYAHPGNPKRDVAKSIASFQDLIQDYPQSPWREKARVCMGMVWGYEKSKDALEKAIQDRTKLFRENEKIAGDNEKLKKSLANAAEENEKSKQALAAAIQESTRLKNIIDEWKKVDRELEGKKRGRVR
jgi:tetratricopeptide (TPR) repeat protein